MRTSIWFVRHGQTLANQQRRYQSRSDTPLTAYGQRQICALARRLQRIPFDVALVSPTERTHLMASAILADRPSIAHVMAPAWIETDHGDWEGLTYHEVLARFPHTAQQRFSDVLHGKATHGESLAEVATRVAGAWSDLLQHYRGGRVLVVTHATPIQLALCTVSGVTVTRHWQWRVDLGSITALDVYASNTIVRMVNEVPRIAVPKET